MVDAGRGPRRRPLVLRGRRAPRGVSTRDVTDVDPGSSFERPSISTPLDGVGNQVYVTATRFAEEDPTLPPTAIAFGRSDNGGQSWSATEVLDAGDAEPLPILVQGARAAGGRGGEVLVAWYHSGDDGHLVGDFEIRVRRSLTNGRTWGPMVVAARDATETGRDLGPLDYYKQWWPTMFPDVAVDRSGRAHIVYGHDPEAGNTTAEEGDVRYVTSRRTPWTEWSAPITLNDDGPGRAQGYASLTVRHQGRQSVADVVWEDTRLTGDLPVVGSPAFSSPNQFYDIYHTRWLRAVGGLLVREPAGERCLVASGPRDERGPDGRHRERSRALRGVDRPAGHLVRRQPEAGRRRQPGPAPALSLAYRTNDSRREASESGIEEARGVARRSSRGRPRGSSRRRS